MEFIATKEKLDTPIVIGATGMEAIEQNMQMIIKTLSYSVPLNRAFAGMGEFMDSPSPHHTARLIAELTESLEKYEPRIKVESIRFKSYGNENGTLHPVITYRIREGVVI